jgi:hypothetical protein
VTVMEQLCTPNVWDWARLALPSQVMPWLSYTSDPSGLTISVAPADGARKAAQTDIKATEKHRAKPSRR